MKLKFVVPAFAMAASLFAAVSFADGSTSSKFEGNAANTGTVTFYHEGGRNILKVSDDFQVPKAPAPTWRVVDSKGNIYTLDAFNAKAGEKRQVVVPAYVHDVKAVQVYCAFVEVLLGEASFSQPQK